MVFMLTRLFGLAIVIILVRKADGQDAGLTALAVVVFAFTVSLFISALNRPTRSRPR
jgi:flavin reductase (DIM6/NTAB) family NADH-FMN oxidoreductase RutF